MLSGAASASTESSEAAFFAPYASLLLFFFQQHIFFLSFLLHESSAITARWTARPRPFDSCRGAGAWILADTRDLQKILSV
jgi:hypothetical protein